MPATARKYNVSEHRLYVWRRRFERMEVREVVELKRRQQENARLKKLVTERDLDLEVVKEIVAKNPERAGTARVCTARGTVRGKPGAGVPSISRSPLDTALRGEAPGPGGGAGCVDAHTRWRGSSPIGAIGWYGVTPGVSRILCPCHFQYSAALKQSPNSNRN